MRGRGVTGYGDYMGVGELVPQAGGSIFGISHLNVLERTLCWRWWPLLLCELLSTSNNTTHTSTRGYYYKHVSTAANTERRDERIVADPEGPGNRGGSAVNKLRTNPGDVDSFRLCTFSSPNFKNLFELGGRQCELLEWRRVPEALRVRFWLCLRVLIILTRQNNTQLLHLLLLPILQSRAVRNCVSRLYELTASRC